MGVRALPLESRRDERTWAGTAKVPPPWFLVQDRQPPVGGRGRGCGWGHPVWEVCPSASVEGARSGGGADVLGARTVGSW